MFFVFLIISHYKSIHKKWNVFFFLSFFLLGHAARSRVQEEGVWHESRSLQASACGMCGCPHTRAHTPHICVHTSGANVQINAAIWLLPLSSIHTRTFSMSQWLNSYGDMIIIHTYIHTRTHTPSEPIVTWWSLTKHTQSCGASVQISFNHRFIHSWAERQLIASILPTTITTQTLGEAITTINCLNCFLYFLLIYAHSLLSGTKRSFSCRNWPVCVRNSTRKTHTYRVRYLNKAHSHKK